MSPTRIILDTDMSIDTDDAGALCIANALHDLGEAELLAVTLDTGNAYGVAAISAINQYYGHGEIPIGAYRGDIGAYEHTPEGNDWTNRGQGWYTADLARNVSQDTRHAPDAIDVLRTTLAGVEADRSVTIVAVGHATNLIGLLTSPADSSSPLDGKALVALKVRELVWMGGSFWDSIRVEWNFGAYGQATWAGAYNDVGRSTNMTLDIWPTSVPIKFMSFDTGASVFTGGVLYNGAPADSPCRQAYMSFCGVIGGAGGLPSWCNEAGRNAWDLMAVDLAVRGARNYYFLQPGRNTVERHSGRNVWLQASNQSDVNAAQYQAFLPELWRGDVARQIDELLLLPTRAIPPSPAPPGPPSTPPAPSRPPCQPRVPEQAPSLSLPPPPPPWRQIVHTLPSADLSSGTDFNRADLHSAGGELTVFFVVLASLCICSAISIRHFKAWRARGGWRETRNQDQTLGELLHDIWEFLSGVVRDKRHALEDAWLRARSFSLSRSTFESTSEMSIETPSDMLEHSDGSELVERKKPKKPKRRTRVVSVEETSCVEGDSERLIGDNDGQSVVSSVMWSCFDAEKITTSQESAAVNLPAVVVDEANDTSEQANVVEVNEDETEVPHHVPKPLRVSDIRPDMDD